MDSRIFACIVSVIGLPLISCGGTITVVSDLRAGDGGVSGDGGGPADSGDPIDSGTADSGCRARPDPPFPASWPFPATKAAYTAEFWTSLPSRTCGLSICHAVGAPQLPVIPDTAAELDNAATLMAAQDTLWARAIPTTIAGSPTPTSQLVWNHRPTDGTFPQFTPEQVSFVNAFIARGKVCAWKEIIDRERTTGPTCSDGQCDCPLPNLDVSYCKP